MTQVSLLHVTSRYVQCGTNTLKSSRKGHHLLRQFHKQGCRKLDPVSFVLCGTGLQWASLPALKYMTAKQPVRFHTSLYAAQVTRKHLANTYSLATEAKEGNSFIKYSANYAQPVSSILWGLTHSLPQVIVHVLLVKAYLVLHVDQEQILLCIVLPLVCPLSIGRPCWMTRNQSSSVSVSYTHLTLPTSCCV